MWIEVDCIGKLVVLDDVLYGIYMLCVVYNFLIMMELMYLLIM